MFNPHNTSYFLIRKPFISRVDPKDDIGLNPCKIMQHRVYKQDNEKLIQHKKWLKEYSLRTKLMKEQTGESSDVTKEKMKKVPFSIVKRESSSEP